MALPGLQFARTAVDARMLRRSERMLGRFVHQPWYGPGDAISSVFPSRINGYAVASIRFYPRVVPDAFVPVDPAADSAGLAWPAGTKWVSLLPTVTGYVSQKYDALSATFWIPSGISIAAGKTAHYQFIAYGIPAGSNGTITATWITAGTVAGTLPVSGANGAQQILDWDIAGMAGDTIKFTSSWSAGDPPYQGIIGHPLYGFTACAAVPPTVPAGFTYRSGAEDQFINPVGLTVDNEWPGRANFNAHPIANHGIDALYAGQAYWIPELMGFWVNGPAINGAVDTLSHTGTADVSIPNPFPPPANIIIPIPPAPDQSVQRYNGWRKVVAVFSGGDGVQSFTHTFTRSDTGAVTTTTYTTPTTIDFGNFEPATPQMVTGTSHWSHPAGYTGSPPGVTLTLHPSASVPIPFTATNTAGEVVPGGIHASMVATGVNSQPMDVFAGATGTPTYEACAFTIAADGWYEITQAGTPLTNIGENEFDYLTGNPRTVDRGRAGRRFYAIASPAVLATRAAYVPAFGAIAGAGSTFLTTVRGGWAFKTIALPASGAYEIRITPTDVDQVRRGVVFEWTADAADPTCINPQGKEVWEPWDLSSYAWKGTTLSTPPGSLVDTDAYIVGPNPTGAWASFAPNSVAVYNGILRVWECIPASRLEAGMWLLKFDGSTWTWWNGRAWKAATDPVIVKRITVAAATMLYCTFGAFTSSASASPHITASWAVVP